VAIRQHSTVGPDGLRIGFAFSDRWDGVSKPPYGELNLGGHVGDDPEAVAENRRALAEALGFPEAARVVYMNQVHGADVEYVAMPWQGRAPDVDALVTDRPGLGLAVLVADCVPVLLADPAAGVVAAAHAGRPGLRAGVVPATVERMAALGAEPSRIVAATGPSVCGLCYEVPEQMRADVAGRVPAAYARTRQGTPALDVIGGVWAQLAEAGIDVGNSVRDPECTLESHDFFSFRRDGTTGRFAGVVWFDQ
jgi:YfiH family protein